MGAHIVETPGMYRLLQGDAAGADWASARNALDPVRDLITDLLRHWRQAPDIFADCAIDSSITLSEAERVVADCPFLPTGQMEVTWID
jgi:hypothetical protein